MARITSSSRRAALRAPARLRRAAQIGKPGQKAPSRAKEAPPTDNSETEGGGVRLKRKRRQIKAARAALRADRRRSGFGKALRTEIRAKHRHTARQVRLRAANRPRK